MFLECCNFQNVVNEQIIENFREKNIKLYVIMKMGMGLIKGRNYGFKILIKLCLRCRFVFS